MGALKSPQSFGERSITHNNCTYPLDFPPKFTDPRGVVASLSVGKEVVFLFDVTTGDLSRIFKPFVPQDGFGATVDLDGGHAIVGAWGDLANGRANVFDIASGELLHVFEEPSISGLALGFSLEADNGRLIVSSPFTTSMA